MENTLTAFLAQNVAQDELFEFIPSNRFLDSKGNPITWKLKTISADEDEQLRISCTKKVPVLGKRGTYQQELNTNQYVGKMASMCVVYPDLTDAELQNSYGVMGDDNLLKKMLKSGEYAALLNKVQEINGFDITTQDLVDEAKN